MMINPNADILRVTRFNIFWTKVELDIHSICFDKCIKISDKVSEFYFLYYTLFDVKYAFMPLIYRFKLFI
jgi:hypothetical protein